MGNTNSAPIDEERRGFHVLKVKPNSPASEAGLDGYFDFIIEINGQSLHDNSNLFPTTIKGNIGKEVSCLVYSEKTRDFRVIALTPRLWATEADGFLGCSIRYCDYNGSFANLWHVVEVLPDSPASKAGLIPETDYIVGSPEAILRDHSELYQLIASCANECKSLRLFVYSSLEKCIRETSLERDDAWKGPGLIGAELAFGALHRIPTENVDPDSNRHNVPNDYDYKNAVPAAVAATVIPPPPLSSNYSGIDIVPHSKKNKSPSLALAHVPSIGSDYTSGFVPTSLNLGAQISGKVPSFVPIATATAAFASELVLPPSATCTSYSTEENHGPLFSTIPVSTPPPPISPSLLPLPLPSLQSNNVPKNKADYTQSGLTAATGETRQYYYDPPRINNDIANESSNKLQTTDMNLSLNSNSNYIPQVYRLPVISPSPDDNNNISHLFHTDYQNKQNANEVAYNQPPLSNDQPKYEYTDYNPTFDMGAPYKVDKKFQNSDTAQYPQYNQNQNQPCVIAVPVSVPVGVEIYTSNIAAQYSEGTDESANVVDEALFAPQAPSAQTDTAALDDFLHSLDSENAGQASLFQFDDVSGGASDVNRLQSDAED